MLGSPAAKRLQVLKVGPELVNTTTIYFKDSDINGIVGCFSKVFSGVGKLSAATSLTLHINIVKYLQQKHRNRGGSLTL